MRPAAWHVHFDGDLDKVVMHACELHRALADSLPECEDARQPNGDCSHVQMRPCACAPQPECEGCELDRFDGGLTTRQWTEFASSQRKP